MRTHPPKGRPFLARIAWWYLVRRRWVWRVNAPDQCSSIYEADDGQRYDRGWRPIFSIRYGKTPVFVVERRLRA